MEFWPLGISESWYSFFIAVKWSRKDVKQRKNIRFYRLSLSAFRREEAKSQKKGGLCETELDQLPQVKTPCRLRVRFSTSRFIT